MYCSAVLSRSVMSESVIPWAVAPPGTSVHGDAPGKNTGVSPRALLQGIFPTQGSNPGLLHYKRILNWLSHQGSINSFNTTVLQLADKKAKAEK